MLHANWTVVGSAGTIDESDLGKIVLNNDGSASIRSTISSTSAKIRFNVVEDTLLEPPAPGVDVGSLVFAMRVRDNGPGSRVLATLKRIVLGFDPDFSPQNRRHRGYDRQRPGAVERRLDQRERSALHRCCFAFNPLAGGQEGMLWANSGWIAEVQLIKHDSTGNPAVMGVSIFREQP